jgi:hypothetical protein
MLDSEYFRTTLQRDVDALGGSAVVELSLLSGRAHHLQSVVSVQGGYVTLEVYRPRSASDRTLDEPRWKEDRKAAAGGAAAGAGASYETQRVVVSYESMAAVSITAVRPAGGPRIGFVGRG